MEEGWQGLTCSCVGSLLSKLMYPVHYYYRSHSSLSALHQLLLKEAKSTLETLAYQFV